jgi:SAM-dependent methyltransferase
MYTYQNILHNSNCSKKLAEMIVKEFKPKAIFDVGCGLGNFINDFMNMGVNAVGTDGQWALDSKKLVCDKSSILVQDLNNPSVVIPGNTDVVLSLEVAEHLQTMSSDKFVDYLTSTGSLVIFSAATPWQGGQGHINEQLSTYWIDIFRSKGYLPSNYLRCILWENHEIFPWYRQNILVFYKSPHLIDFPFLQDGNNSIYNIFSPYIYMPKAKEMHKFWDGRSDYRFLIRAIIKKVAYKFGYRSAYMYKND